MKKTKKIALMLMTVVLMAVCCVFGASAEEILTDGYYSYTVTDGEATITDVDTSISGDIVIPSTLGGYPVVAIGDWSFDYCRSLKNVNIPDSVTSIGRYAFTYCENLTSITIPDSVTSIGRYAFMCCENLTSITIPDSVTSISDGAFYYCNSLTSITIGKGVTHIGYEAFDETKSLTNIEVDPSNTCYSDVDGVLFNKDKSILIKYPSGNTGTSYTIPDGVTSIGECAFYNCSSLKTVTIKEGVQRIDYHAFYNCTSLCEISIPESVESIGESVFKNTGYYNNEDNWDGNCLYIDNCLVDIISYLYAPEKVYIDENIRVICDSLYDSVIESIEVNENNPYFSSDEYGVLYNKDKTKMLVYPHLSKNATYVFPDTVKEISVMYSVYLRSIVIPQSVEKITDPTFATLGLKDIYIHNDNIILHKDSMLGYTFVNPEAFEMYLDEYLELCVKAEQGTITEEEYIRCQEISGLISDGTEDTPYGTIHANAGSTAEAYAKENGINFELLTDDEPQESTTVKDTETNVEIEFDSSAFETEVSLVVSEDAVNADIVFGDEYENYKAFDISIEANGEKVQPNGKVTVKLPLPEGFDAETTKVYYVDENGNKEEIESTVEDGFVIFETDHFSEYVLVDESTKHEHSYTGTVTKEPTCTEPGVKTFICSCNDSYTDPVAATGHSHKAVTTAPTCTEKGYTTYTCSCGDSYVADYVNALGHKDTNGDYKCDNGCGYEYEKPAEPEVPSDPSENCSCNCHKGGFMGFIWKIINFFQKLFKANPVCACGAAHY